MSAYRFGASGSVTWKTGCPTWLGKGSIMRQPRSGWDSRAVRAAPRCGGAAEIPAVVELFQGVVAVSVFQLVTREGPALEAQLIRYGHLSEADVAEDHQIAGEGIPQGIDPLLSVEEPAGHRFRLAGGIPITAMDDVIAGTKAEGHSFDETALLLFAPDLLTLPGRQGQVHQSETAPSRFGIWDSFS